MYNYYFSSLICDKERRLYSELLSQILKKSPVAYIEKSDCGTVNKIIRYILVDNPQLIWYEGKWSTVGETDIEVVLFEYTLSDFEIATFEVELEQIVKPFLSGELGDFDKIKLVYDFLVNKVVYDKSANYSQTAYGALIDGRAVCKGISKAFQLILNNIGINSSLVDGSLDGIVRHVWNIVELEGKAFHTDVTLGKKEFKFLFERKNIEFDGYNVFLVSDKTIRCTHIYQNEIANMRCEYDYKR